MTESRDAPKTIGKYTLLRELGRGGMGVVYCAQDTTLGRIVALKTLYPSLGQDPLFITRFREEARNVATLSHPNIVRIHSFEEIEGQQLIDMEYIDGPPICDLLQGEVVTPAWLLGRLRGVIEALAVCHKQGLVHRDVKPGNILVDRDGRSVLTDFGLATAYATHLRGAVQKTSSTGFFLGTPRYAPPEAWENLPATPAWDVYSLGIVLYEMLSGCIPYDGATPLEIMRNILLNEVAPLAEVAPQVSAPLALIVDKMLSHDLAVRPPHAQAVFDALRQTPEWSGAADAHATTVAGPTRMRQPLRLPKAWQTRPALGAWKDLVVGLSLGVGLLALSLGAILGYLARGVPALPRAIPEGTAVLARTQEGHMRDALFSAEVLKSLSRYHNAPESMVFEASNLDPRSSFAPRATAWVVEPDANTPGRALVVTANGIWSLAVDETPEQDWILQGDAAYFSMPGGQGLRRAALTGRGRRLGTADQLVVSLEFTDASDRTRRTWEGTLHAHPTLTTDTAFLLALEETPGVLALLYRELIPRRLPWAVAIEATLPAVVGARLNVPFLGLTPDYAVDGMLAESHWKEGYFDKEGRMGVAAGRPLLGNAHLRGVAHPEGLLLAFEAPRGTGAGLRLRVALTPATELQPSMTPVYAFEFSARGINSAHLSVDGREQPWQCQWLAACRQDEDGWTGEIFIPAADWREAVRPAPGQYWRLNAVLEETDAQGNQQAVAQWGYPEPLQTNHGMLLRFAEVTGPNTESFGT